MQVAQGSVWKREEERVDIHRAIHLRRTVHRYDDQRDVSPAHMDRAFEAAVMAPNHLMTWPWRFHRVGPVGREVLAEVYVRLKTAGKDATPKATQRLRAKMLDAPELVVVSQRLAGDPLREREDYAACAAAIQNFMLSLAGDGVGSKWSTSGVIHDEETYALLQIDPDEQTILGLVWAGYPQGELSVPERPPWDQFVRRVE
jgi:nitroreductase